MLCRLHDSDRGASLVEYAAVILLVTGITAVVFSMGLAGQVQQAISSAVECAVAPGSECVTDGAGVQADDGLASQPEGDQGLGLSGESDSTDSPFFDDGIPLPHEAGSEGRAEALSFLGDFEGYDAQPLFYQPESGNGVTPTYDSYGAVVETVSDDGRNHQGDDGYETEFTEDGTAGSEKDEDFDESGLGPLVEGSSTGEEVHPLEWDAPNAHNEHGSKDATEEHEETHRYWVNIAMVAGAIRLENASQNMIHFLANSGEPLEQDVDDMLDSVENFSSAAEIQQQNLIQTAILRAEEEGGNGPYTFPVRTDWSQHAGNPMEDGMDWFFASGSWAYSQTGEITVARDDDGSWSYDMEVQVHIRDQYDWHGADDGGLKVDIPFIGEVRDEELAELTRAGLAQEFPMYGTSAPVSRSGSYSPEEGLHGDSASGPGTR